MAFRDEAFAAIRRGETDVVARLSQTELARARAAGYVAGEVEALCMQARVALVGDDLAAAGSLAAEALSVAVRADDRGLGRGPIHILACVARMSGDLDSARIRYGESIALSESLGLADSVVSEQHNLGYVELHAGNVARARQLFDTARRQAVARDIAGLLPYVAIDAAVVADIDGDHGRAAELLAVADKLLRERGEVLDPDDAAEHEALRNRLVTALGQVEFDAHCASGSTQEWSAALAG